MAASIKIRLFGTLRSFRPADPDAHPLERGTTIAQLLTELEIPPGKVHLTFVNGVQTDTGAELCDGDELRLFPAIGGG